MLKNEPLHKLLNYMIYRLALRVPFIEIIYTMLDLSDEMPKEVGRDVYFTTDGFKLYVNDSIMQMYHDYRDVLERELLHELMHVYFGHPVVAKKKERKSYDAWCDQVVDDWIKEEVLTNRKNDVYRFGKAKKDDYVNVRHNPWYESEKLEGEGVSSAEIVWKQMREQIDNLEGEKMQNYGRDAGDAAGCGAKKLERMVAGEVSYMEVLERYFRFREQLCKTDEEIDYLLYSYGFELYGDVTFVEPPEVIDAALVSLYMAVDVSGSCNMDMVEKFVGQTQQIIKQLSGNERKELDIYLILCDIEIVQEFHITKLDDFPNSSELLISHGGTDFVPVFERVEEIERLKENSGRVALFYYTDGYGRFPDKKPEFETYFLMEKRDYDVFDGPQWIRKLLIS